MITEEGMKVLADKAALLAAVRGKPSPEIEKYGSASVLIEFKYPWTRGEIEDLMEGDFPDETGLDAESGLWWSDYLEATGEGIPDGMSEDEIGGVYMFDLPDSMCAFSPEEIEEWRKDAIIPVMDEWKKPEVTNVYLPLRYGYYDMIERGDKTVESREYNENWVKRLLSPPNLKTVTFQRGYAKGSDKMVFEIAGIELADEDGSRRYKADAIPDMSRPSWILIRLGKRIA